MSVFAVGLHNFFPFNKPVWAGVGPHGGVLDGEGGGSDVPDDMKENAMRRPKQLVGFPGFPFTNEEMASNF
jgi:hypothetical protein